MKTTVTKSAALFRILIHAFDELINGPPGNGHSGMIVSGWERVGKEDDDRDEVCGPLWNLNSCVRRA